MNANQILGKIQKLKERNLRGETLALKLSDFVEDTKKMSGFCRSQPAYERANDIYRELLPQSRCDDFDPNYNNTLNLPWSIF